MPQRRLRLLTRGDIVEIDGQTFCGRIAAAFKPLVDRLRIKLIEFHRLAGLGGAMIAFVKFCSIRLGEKFPHAAAQQLLGAHADDPRGLLADVDVTPVFIQHREAVSDAAHDGLQSVVGLL